VQIDDIVANIVLRGLLQGHRTDSSKALCSAKLYDARIASATLKAADPEILPSAGTVLNPP